MYANAMCVHPCPWLEHKRLVEGSGPPSGHFFTFKSCRHSDTASKAHNHLLHRSECETERTFPQISNISWLATKLTLAMECLRKACTLETRVMLCRFNTPGFGENLRAHGNLFQYPSQWFSTKSFFACRDRSKWTLQFQVCLMPARLSHKWQWSWNQSHHLSSHTNAILVQTTVHSCTRSEHFSTSRLRANTSDQIDTDTWW